MTGRGQPDLTDLAGLRPYLQDADVAVLGVRDEDECLAELHALAVPTWPVARIRADGAAACARQALARVAWTTSPATGSTSTSTSSTRR